jgi:uncharacterized protein YecE (DUF72 family)
MAAGPVRIGCASWALPPAVQHQFPPGDSHLARYASVFSGAEINSSFHRPHRPSTYERWAASVPDTFVFSAKLPKAITHERRLVDCDEPLRAFLDEADGLGGKLRCLLVQLPPSLAFDAAVADTFFAQLQQHSACDIALEPRHASWFDEAVDGWLATRRITRVLADPVRHDAGRWPGGRQDFVYLRLHGAPRMYYSAYEPAVLQALAARIAQASREGREVWCMFDNTAGQEAAGNALQLQRLLAQTNGG